MSMGRRGKLEPVSEAQFVSPPVTLRTPRGDKGAASAVVTK